jgi:hypothetical protein
MSNHALDLTVALDAARQSRKWVVLVCANDEQLMAYRRSLSAALEPEDRFSGRTAHLDGGGVLSVVHQSDEPFSPDGQPISVQFVGLWSSAHGKDRMDVWRAAASEIL